MKDSSGSPLAGSKSKALLSEFKPATYEAWKRAAEALLKGAPFEKKLLSTTYEGITLQPIYNASDVAGLPHLKDFPGFSTHIRASNVSGYVNQPWLVSQELPCSTPEEFNVVALHELMQGQTELNVLVDLATANGLDPDSAKAGEVGACGVSLSMLQDFERAFRKVDASAVPVYFQAGSSALPVMALWFALARKQGLSLQSLRGGVEMDPLGVLARQGKLPHSIEQAYCEMAQLSGFVKEWAIPLQTVSVQTNYVHDRGGNAVQELAFALAAGVEYIRAMDDRGLKPEDMAPRMRFSFGIGSQFFPEVAKFRAARLLWSRVLEAFDVPENRRGMIQHARTSIWNKTRIDPYVNMLRTTTEAFSAALGGVQSMHVGPFDEGFRVPDGFSRRIARNTHTILQEECDLTRVIDPAGGSWFVETLTSQLVQKAWALFQDTEKEGGMLAALQSGWVQQQIEAVAAKRVKSLGERREVQVGINNYPNPKEEPQKAVLPDYAQILAKRSSQISSYRTSATDETDLQVMESLATLAASAGVISMEVSISAAQAGASLGELVQALRSKDTGTLRPEIQAMPARRASTPYEDLRDACWSHQATTGKRPSILQANIGPSRTYRARADWCSNFFMVGGFDVQGARDFFSVDEIVEAVKASESRVVVLCSTDETYLQSAGDAARKIKELDGTRTVLLAGAPGEQETVYKESGIDGFVHVRVNNYETLRGLLKQTGVRS